MLQWSEAPLEKVDKIVRYIWSLTPKIASDANYEHLSLAKRLELIRAHRIAVLCAGLRNLAVSLIRSVFPELQVRKIGAYRFNYRKTPGVIVNSHALMEIKISGQWVLIDPTYCCFFVDKTGCLLDATQIRSLKRAGRLREISGVFMNAGYNIHSIPETNSYMNKIFDALRHTDQLDDPKNHPYFCVFELMEWTTVQ